MYFLSLTITFSLPTFKKIWHQLVTIWKADILGSERNKYTCSKSSNHRTMHQQFVFQLRNKLVALLTENALSWGVLTYIVASIVRPHLDYVYHYWRGCVCFAVKLPVYIQVIISHSPHSDFRFDCTVCIRVPWTVQCKKLQTETNIYSRYICVHFRGNRMPHHHN